MTKSSILVSRGIVPVFGAAANVSRASIALPLMGREIPSSAIGAKVLEKLRGIDEVAYLRYASVYQRFQDVDQFVDAIHTLGRRVKPNTLQRELFPPETAENPAGESRNLAINKNHGRV